MKHGEKDDTTCEYFYELLNEPVILNFAGVDV